PPPPRPPLSPYTTLFRSALRLSAPGARPRAHRGGDRRGDGHIRGRGREDPLDLPGAPLAGRPPDPGRGQQAARLPPRHAEPRSRDRKSTRLNSSHVAISY